MLTQRNILATELDTDCGSMKVHVRTAFALVKAYLHR